jgi:glutathione synthase/RimK-type ligase-like ATP-grasp enzyme
VSRRVAILTPGGDGYGTRWKDVLADKVAPLEAAGIDVEARSWTDAGDLSAFDLTLPLLVWGYHVSVGWAEQVTRWESQGVRLLNPPDVLRWNADKLYLRRLQQRGARIVPTMFVERVDEDALNGAAEAFGSEKLVAKPRISAGAFETIRWSPGQRAEGGPSGSGMIQPYLPSIETSGEVSLIYVGGAFSHAISKVPQPGDFRVQPEYDGIIAAHAPTADEMAAAEGVLAAAGEEFLYARIDLVRDLEDRPALIELELVEPDLFLGFDPHAPRRFADAVKDALA